jgi:hypothetical protein
MPCGAPLSETKRKNPLTVQKSTLVVSTSEEKDLQSCNLQSMCDCKWGGEGFEGLYGSTWGEQGHSVCRIQEKTIEYVGNL